MKTTLSIEEILELCNNSKLSPFRLIEIFDLSEDFVIEHKDWFSLHSSYQHVIDDKFKYGIDKFSPKLISLFWDQFIAINYKSEKRFEFLVYLFENHSCIEDIESYLECLYDSSYDEDYNFVTKEQFIILENIINNRKKVDSL